MNIKPTPEQVDNWELKAAQYADSQTGEYYEYQQAKNEKFAELAAQWGAEQVQYNEADELLRNLGLDPDTYRTDGGYINPLKVKAAIRNPDKYSTDATQAQQTTNNPFNVTRPDEPADYGHDNSVSSAYQTPYYCSKCDTHMGDVDLPKNVPLRKDAICWKCMEQAQQPPVEGPELPEPVATVESAIRIADGFHCLLREDAVMPRVKDKLYTADQMHEHYAAGVRAGKATGKQRLQVPTGWAAPKDQYAVPVLFNPYTGEPRDVRDVQSDPQGILIVPPGKVHQLAAMQGGQK